MLALFRSEIMRMSNRHRLLKGNESARSCDIAAKWMIDYQQIELPRDCGDWLLLEIAQRPHRPLDCNVGMSAPECIAQRLKRSSGAAVPPSESPQVQIAHTPSLSLV
jgi:hypothetical protein